MATRATGKVSIFHLHEDERRERICLPSPVQRRSRACLAADDRALLGWEGGSTPAEGRAESRPVGRGDRRRSGGNADHAARRSRRRLTREPTASTGGDRWSAGEHRAAGRLNARPGRRRANSPTANAAGAGGLPGDRRGAAAPLARARMFYIACAGLATVTWLKPAPNAVSTAARTCGPAATSKGYSSPDMPEPRSTRLRR